MGTVGGGIISPLDVALGCIARGWYVVPCYPGTKIPSTPHGFKDNTSDEAEVRAWWAKFPDHNVGIVPNVSGLTVLDVDKGIADYEGAMEFLGALPGACYAVRTGRRPDFGLQVYFKGGDQQSVPWAKDGFSGDIRSESGLVMAAGCLHKSGERYELLLDGPLQPAPQWVRELKRPEAKREDGTLRQLGPGDGQHDRMTQHAGRLRALGYDGDQIYAVLPTFNEVECVPPLPDEDIKSIAYGVAERYEAGQQVGTVSWGGVESETEAKKLPDDWRELFHTFDEMKNAPPTTFFIENFLMEDGITGLAAVVCQRKSLIAQNVIHSLCTGEPLFGEFKVVKRPARVLYLCPEMGLSEVSGRLRKLKVLEYVGSSLFCRTMNSEIVLDLPDIPAEALEGAVLIVDTAVRFLEGDENSSEHMRKFAAKVFALRNASAGVLLLYHSTKGARDGNDLTLESSLRGSGELGAALSTCWATRLLDPNEPFASLSLLKNVKPRDFQTKPFLLASDDDGVLTYKGPAEPQVMKPKNAANKDGKDDAATEIVKANMDTKAEDIVAMFAAAGIDNRKVSWVKDRKAKIRGSLKHTEG